MKTPINHHHIIKSSHHQIGKISGSEFFRPSGNFTQNQPQASNTAHSIITATQKNR